MEGTEVVWSAVLAVLAAAALGLAGVAVVHMQHRFAVRLLDRGLTPAQTAKLVQASSRPPVAWNASQSFQNGD